MMRLYIYLYPQCIPFLKTEWLTDENEKYMFKKQTRVIANPSPLLLVLKVVDKNIQMCQENPCIIAIELRGVVVVKRFLNFESAVWMLKKSKESSQYTS